MSVTTPEPLPLSSPYSVPASREREVVASTSSLQEVNKQEKKEDQGEDEEKEEEKEEAKELNNQLREMEEPIETPITREDQGL